MLIFVLDDERLILNGMKRTVSEAAPEAEVIDFNNVPEALEYITDKGRFPDVVFSDIEMPGITGLEFAAKLKTVSPDTRIVFVTAYSEYAIEAFKVRAHGYILKPITADAVKEELDHIPVIEETRQDRLKIQCFGHFEVYWKGEPVIFQRKQTKELFAYLIDRQGAACTNGDICTALWENENDMTAASQRIRNLISDLRHTLESIGMEDVLVRYRRQIAIKKDMVDCDYFHFLDGEIAYVNAFRGEYMIDYSWAEITAAWLYQKSGF